ncbi:MAG: hypothetical protein LUH05_06600 [Candidatus Gastranaerophilales bacterium]|nr:hypothetical protein [Candidatus Gastranaerophilales bacterium]
MSMSVGPIEDFSVARSDKTQKSEKVTNPSGQGLTLHSLDEGDVFERLVGKEGEEDTVSYSPSFLESIIKGMEREREMQTNMMKSYPGFVTYTGTDPYLADVQKGIDAVEESSKDADFIVNDGKYCNKEWGKKNDDGTYTIYAQEVKGGSQPYEVETVTEEEAKAKGYIS